MCIRDRFRVKHMPYEQFRVDSVNLRFLDEIVNKCKPVSYTHLKKLGIEKPQTFDEKIWWLKLHYFNPLMTICTDKYLVRKYVEKCGLRDILNECYANFTSVDDIDIEKLPNEFFLKCNHLSGCLLYTSRCV